MSVLEAAANVQDQVLDAIKTSQDALLSAVKAVAENAAPLTEKLPAAPFASQLPDGVDVVNTAFGFAEKLLANQKEFTTKLIEAYSPAKSATKSAIKSTPKAA
jgi:hypothetical protein